MEKNTSVPTPSQNNKSNTEIKCSSCTCTEDKVSIVTIVCRICYDDDKDESIITPCRCKGTVAFVHRSCLETWLAESNTTSCELCHHIYKTERTPKYSARRSIWHWIRHQPANLTFQVRGIRSDLLACALLTPLAIIITYVCLFSADYYNQQRFSNIPAARWTSVSLLIMIAIMLIGYYLWAYSVIRYHGRVWFYWWQRECVVRYIPPSSANLCCAREHEPENTTEIVSAVPVNNSNVNSDTQLEIAVSPEDDINTEINNRTEQISNEEEGCTNRNSETVDL